MIREAYGPWRPVSRERDLPATLPFQIDPPPGIVNDHLTIGGIAIDVDPETTIAQMAMILHLGTIEMWYKEAPEDKDPAYFSQPMQTVPIERMSGVLYRVMEFKTRTNRIIEYQKCDWSFAFSFPRVLKDLSIEKFEGKTQIRLKILFDHIKDAPATTAAKPAGPPLVHYSDKRRFLRGGPPRGRKKK